MLEGILIIALIEPPGGSYFGSFEGLVEMRHEVAVAGAGAEVRWDENAQRFALQALRDAIDVLENGAFSTAQRERSTASPYK